MLSCQRCSCEFRDGVQCSLCQGHFDFPCAGITEGGYRKLGDRRNNWKCSTCKSSGTPSPLHQPSMKTSSAKSPTPVDMEGIGMELKRLSAQLASLPALTASVKAIQADIADLRTMKSDIADLKLLKPELSELKASMEFYQHSMETLTSRTTEIGQEVQGLLKSKEEVQLLRQRVDHFEKVTRDFDQRSRMNNIEIKGVPISPSENLFDIFSKLGEHINYVIPKENINYIARIPMRNEKHNKTIIVSVHNRYAKEDFVASAKKRTIVPVDLSLHGDGRIYVNDHLTLENKTLLNKAKNIAKERGFAFTWVKACKIFVRKNPTSPVIAIKSELDLKKLS